MKFLFSFPELYFYFITGLIGLVIGSFLNVVALRLLSEKDFVKGRSKCPKCENLIAWYDNIPVLSYILLQGKCRSCKEPISRQYPLVEIFTAGMFVAVAANFGFTLNSLFLLILVCNLIVITITDLKEQYIYDINSIPLIPIGLIYNFFDIGNNSLETIKIFGIPFNDMFLAAIIGAIIGAAFFEILSRVGLLLAGEYAFGPGDTFLGAALGAWFGWKLMVVIIALSFLSQMFYGVPIIAKNMFKAKDYQSLWAMVMLFVSVGLIYLGKYFINNFQLDLGTGITIFSLIIAGIGIYIIMKNTRQRKSHTFLPFGPALVFAAFLVIFFSEEFLVYLPF